MQEITTYRDAVRTALANRPRTLTYKKIETKIGISEGWLRSFARGEINNPGVNTIELLDNFLNSH